MNPDRLLPVQPRDGMDYGHHCRNDCFLYVPLVLLHLLGKGNKELHAHHMPHESPLTMTFPLMFLALVTIVAGFIPFGHFVSANGESYDIHLDWTVAGTSIAIAVIAIALLPGCTPANSNL